MLPTTTQSLTEYRPVALQQDDFERLDRAAGRNLVFTETQPHEVVVVKDEYGDMVERRRLLAGVALVEARGAVSPVLLASLQRPVNPRHLIVHLTNLTYHKPFSRGQEAWKVVSYDLTRDLEGVSEYAIVKVCEMMRLDPATTFFPDTGVLVKKIRELDAAIKQLGKVAEPKPLMIAKQPKEEIIRTPKTKARISRLTKLATKPRMNWSRWENKFWNAIGRKST